MIGEGLFPTARTGIRSPIPQYNGGQEEGCSPERLPRAVRTLIVPSRGVARTRFWSVFPTPLLSAPTRSLIAREDGRSNAARATKQAGREDSEYNSQEALGKVVMVVVV